MGVTFTRNKWFYIPYFILIGICGFSLIHFSKGEIHLWLNRFNSDFFDVFFKYLTNLGDGICLPAFLLIMIWYRFRNGLYLVVVFLLSGLLVQILKHFAFHDMDRPIKFFGDSVHLHLVDGVHQLCCNSFPSGHSATAFGFYLCFAIVSKSNLLKIAMFILACLVAYSRVYLSQHFLLDIFAGSLIGVVVATASYPWIYSMKGLWLDMNLKQILFRTAK